MGGTETSLGPFETLIRTTAPSSTDSPAPGSWAVTGPPLLVGVALAHPRLEPGVGEFLHRVGETLAAHLRDACLPLALRDDQRDRVAPVDALSRLRVLLDHATLFDRVVRDAAHRGHESRVDHLLQRERLPQ